MADDLRPRPPFYYQDLFIAAPILREECETVNKNFMEARKRLVDPQKYQDQAFDVGACVIKVFDKLDKQCLDQYLKTVKLARATFLRLEDCHTEMQLLKACYYGVNPKTDKAESS